MSVIENECIFVSNPVFCISFETSYGNRKKIYIKMFKLFYIINYTRTIKNRLGF